MIQYGTCGRCSSAQKIGSDGFLEPHKAPHTQHVYALCEGSGTEAARKLREDELWLYCLSPERG